MSTTDAGPLETCRRSRQKSKASCPTGLASCVHTRTTPTLPEVRTKPQAQHQPPPDSPYTQLEIRVRNNPSLICRIYPLARREAPTAGLRPAGEGANIDRRLVPYTRDARRTKSRIEFIYLYIYIFIYMHQQWSSCAASEHLRLVNSLQQKLIG